MPLSLQSSNWDTWGMSQSAVSSPASLDFSITNATGLLYFVTISANATVNGPAGWTLIPVTTVSGMRMHTFYKFSPTGVCTWTWSGTPSWAWTHGGFNGADPLTPVQQVATGTTGTNMLAITAPTITTTGGTGDWIITISSHWIPLSASNSVSYGGLGWPYTTGTGGPPTIITATGQGNSSIGAHNPRYTRAAYPSFGTTLGGWSYRVSNTQNPNGPWPSGSGWASQAFIIRAENTTAGRRFFMIS